MKFIEIGILLIFIGMLFVVIGALTQARADSKVAVGGFIGFIPFGFWNDKRLMWVVIGIMAIFIVFWILNFFLTKN